MQNINKCAIGSASGGDQHPQQENNCRTGSGNNIASPPPVRTGSGWSRRHSSLLSVATMSCQEDNHRLAGRRVTYVPANQARAFRAIRDDERDDAHAIVRRDGVMDWNTRRTMLRNDSAFTTVGYHGDAPHMLPSRAPEHQLNWQPLAEREWRRHVQAQAGVLREARALPGESIQVRMVTTNPPTHFETHYDPTTGLTFQRSVDWSRGGVPTVAQVNSYNQQLRAESTRGGHRKQRGNLVQQHHHHGMHREVQTITLSSSTASSAASGASCRSPVESHAGEKRMNESLASPPESSPSLGSQYDESPSEPAFASNKRMKSASPITQKPVKFDMLDLLCTATLEMGPLLENPSGCSCPKSKCIALYCDCFKAGRRCNPRACTCLNCKNTVEESGANGARSVAIRTILARNPRAFTTAGMANPPKELLPGQVACNCIRSRCLKLYCGCFQAGKACDPKVCTCISCLNTEEDETGARQRAIQQCLEKKPNAFQVKPREVGSGCACKNNRCVRKYCECFRTGLSCTEKCVCRECENMKDKK